jgi:4-amino-4-deoxy-L-arabinose transferase-like glycosyltransferase
MTGAPKPSILYCALLLAIVVPLFSFGIANHGLWTADEPRVSEIGREMALSGDWAVPTLNQKPFLEQPPLYYAALAIVFRVCGGSSDKIARIPSALFAFAGVVALFFLGSLLFGPRTGFIAALIMATCGEYFRVAHWVIVDSALTSFIVLSLTFFIVAYLSDSRKKRLIFYGLCYASCTLAFYTKGFIGVVIPGFAILAFLIFNRNLREILKMHLWLGILIFVVMTLPWFLSLWGQGSGEHLKVFLVHNHLERFAGGSSGHHQPFYYYLVQFHIAFLPWSILIVPALSWSFSKPNRRAERSGRGILLMLCWFIAGFVFLSAASTKRVLYLMPIFAPISLLTAAYIDATLKRPGFGKLENAFMSAFALFPLLAGIAATPALVFASRKYDFGLPAQELGLTILFSVMAVAFSMASFRSRRKDMVRFWGLSTASILSLLFLGLIAAMPILDHFKSFVPFCEKIKTSVPSSDTLYAFRPDEALRGAIPFYTGRFLKEIDSTSQLEEAVQQEKTVFVIIRDKREELERVLLATGKMAVFFKQSMDTERSLVILRNVNTNRAEAPPKLRLLWRRNYTEHAFDVRSGLL